ncbi:hypothetical protein EB796_008348 [Bugula neritina]|uniref:Methyltransferase type 11 domain-containing protein n=1 Tax=Bugula neritina TaxID=10212 RepID=A0A7J7K719_BUGNE|nr:hypothetical protein EB796_008348 [Bugula neritina]
MAFERTTQAAEKYREYQPKHPPELFSLIINFVKDKEFTKYPLAVDVGCGPGLMSTVCLAPYFNKVIGVDISESRIEQATFNKKHSNVEYRLSAAENLPVEEKSVTLIQAATALHWFDLVKFYRECDRVLAPGGVVAAFCYDVLLLVVNHLQSGEINKVNR